MLSVSYAAPGALTDAIDALVDAADTACRQDGGQPISQRTY